MNDPSRDAASRVVAMNDVPARLARIEGLAVRADEPLARHTRFGVGARAAVLADPESEPAFVEALQVLGASAIRWTVIGGGTNLIVNDSGYAGVVLRFRGAALCCDGDQVEAQAGAPLQSVGQFAVGHVLEGLDATTAPPRLHARP